MRVCAVKKMGLNLEWISLEEFRDELREGADCGATHNGEREPDYDLNHCFHDLRIS
jgi:hypothetical protein